MAQVRRKVKQAMRILFILYCSVFSTITMAEMRLAESFDSDALGQAMAYSIYLPPKYDQQGEQRYPVVYLLHGVGDNEKVWPKAGKVAASMDRLIATGEIDPMIIVMPAAKVSWYVDSADVNGPGNYASAVREDLIAHIDATYRTIAARSGRAITGNSMGGFGALRLAFERPELYAATAGLSSALWLHLQDDSVLNKRQESIFRGSFASPFDAARFRRLSPLGLFDKVKAFEQRLAIYLFAGDDDYFGAYRSTAKLYDLLRDAGIKAQLRISDGGHTWSYWAGILADVLRYFDAEFKSYQSTDDNTEKRPVSTTSVPVLRSDATITVPNQMQDIVAAVAALPTHGGTVRVKASADCYLITQSIHINRSNIALLGEPGASLCLGDDVRQPVILIGSAAPSVPPAQHIKNIQITGFTIDGNRSAQGSGPEGESARGREHLKNNAISIHGAEQVYLRQLVLQNARSGGLVISQESSAIFISDVVFANNHFDGIAVDGGHQVFLNHFIAKDNGASGVSIDTGSSQLQISDGLIQDNGHNGIFIRFSSRSRFRNLSIENNCRHGIFASHAEEGDVVPNSGVVELFFSDLDIVRNNGAGLYYGSNSSDPFLSMHNAIHNSRIGGNRAGHIIGDQQGVDELHKDNLLIYSLGGLGAQGNRWCGDG